MGGRERDPETALNLVALQGFPHLRAEAGLRIKVSHIERLLGFDHEPGGSAGQRNLHILGVNLVFSRDGHAVGDRTLLLLLHYQYQEVESDQFAQRCPEASEQGAAFLAGNQRFRYFEERAVLEGTIVHVLSVTRRIRSYNPRMVLGVFFAPLCLRGICFAALHETRGREET